MTGANKITLVLPITNLEYGKITYQSLLGQDMESVKLVLVMDQKEQQLSSDLEEWTKKKKLPAVSCVQVDFCKNINQIQSEVEGLVFFLKEGMKFRKDALLFCKKSIEADGANQTESILLRTLTARRSLISREYESFLESKNLRVDLETNYKLIHRMYYAHGIWANQLCWDQSTAEEKREDMELSIIRLVTCSVCKCHTIRLIKDAKVWIEGARVFERITERYAESYDGIVLMLKQLVVPLMDDFSKNALDTSKNALYIKLYYCNYMAFAITQLGKDALLKEDLAKTILADVMQRLDLFQNEVFCEHPYIASEFRYGFLKLFYTKLPLENPYVQKCLDPAWRDIFLYEVKPQKDATVSLTFALSRMEAEEYELFCAVNKEEYICKKQHSIRENYFWNQRLGTTDIYQVTLPKNSKMDLSFLRKEPDGKKVLFEHMVFQRSVPFSNQVFLYKQFGNQFYYADDACKMLHVRRVNPLKRMALFFKRMVSMISFGKTGVKALAARTASKVWSFFDRRSVWLITDRSNRADDNGEVLFCYLCEHRPANVDVYYVIDADTDDNKRMQQYGKTVAPFSWKHKLLYLRCEVTMSSQANKMVYDPFGSLGALYRDLIFDNRLVFLQHGVTKDNQSKWLNKYNRNLFGFVVNTKAEYDSVFTYDYFYSPERVWLTGMPRFDRLYHDEQKYITIMPTWRKSLSKGTDENGVWLLDDDFKKSSYYIFYNALLNDERLLEAAKRMGYTICFMPHPNIITGLHYFQKHPDVTFFDMTKSYCEVFAQTDLMVTDYSSVAFDFAYLRKPIIYAQFDRAEFFNGAHSYTEGYFDYDLDGFGQVTCDLEQTVDAMIKAMEHKCVLEERYRKRINETFAFDDTDCCKRVLERYLKEREKEA